MPAMGVVWELGPDHHKLYCKIVNESELNRKIYALKVFLFPREGESREYTGISPLWSVPLYPHLVILLQPEKTKSEQPPPIHYPQTA